MKLHLVISSLALMVVPVGRAEPPPPPESAGGGAMVSQPFEGPEIDRAFWAKVQPGRGSIAVADGKLMLTSAGPSWANAHVLSAVRPDLRPFAEPLTIEVAGITMTRDPGVPDDGHSLRVTLTSDGRTEYQSADGVGLELRGNGNLRVGYKLDLADKDPTSAVRLLDTKLAAVPVAVRLTLTADGFRVEADVPAGPGAAPDIKVFQGRWAANRETNFDAAAAASKFPNGAALVVIGQRAPTEPDTATATVALDRITVRAGDSPAGGTVP